MRNIFDKETLNELLEESNLQFFSSGILNVNDPFFITRWNVDSNYFKSTLSYTKLDNESFSIPLADENLPRSWNHFGFNQSFITEGHLNAPYHRNKHVELHYVKEGSFTLKVNQTMITLEAGDICIINPHCYHSDILGPTIKDLELYIVGINEEAVDGYFEQLQEYPLFDNAFIKNNHKSEYVLIHNVEGLDVDIKYFEDHIKELHVDDIFKFLDKVYTYDFELIEEVETSRNTMLFEELRIFIERNYKTVTLEDLEFYFNFSKDHMSRIIKEESGLSFQKYVQKIRMNEAKRLLRETNKSIRDIMIEIGYKNETHFYKIFRENVGANPNEYREKKSK